MKTILFDAGGTLVHPHWPRISRILGRNGVKVDAESLRRAEPEAHFRLDTPEHFHKSNDRSRWAIYLRDILHEAGAGELPETALAALNAEHDRENLWEFLPDDVRPMLESFAGRRMAVVSNSNGTVRRKLETVGIARYFEHIFDSHELGVEKPDPKIFAIALGQMKLRPEETVYLGDLYQVDVVGARAAGIEPFLLDPLGHYEGRDCRTVRTLAEFSRLMSES